jgi:hypothetical protein
MIQSALRSLEKLSTSRLVFEPKIALAKQIAGASEELCSTATSGKRDRVFASYMMSEEPCPKVQKVDHNALCATFMCMKGFGDVYANHETIFIFRFTVSKSHVTVAQ